MKKEIFVVGAVIYREEKILAAKRAKDKSLGGYWEFPGGKIENAESEQEALKREINEELQCNIQILGKIISVRHEYDFAFVNLTTYKCELLSGEPAITEHQEIKWLTRDEFSELKWAPADIPTIELLLSE